MTSEFQSTLEAQPNRAATNVRYEVLAFLSVSAAIAYICRNAVGVAESTISSDLGLSREESGWFMGTFFWSYALLQIPGGWVAQRQGAKFAMLLFTIAGSAATCTIGLAPGLLFLLIGQLLMGASQAGLFPTATVTIAHWTPLAQRAFCCGMLAMGMQLGAVASSVITGRFLTSLANTEIADSAWRWVFFVYSIPGLIWAFLFFFRFHNLPQAHPQVNNEELRLITAGKDSGASSRRNVAPTPWKQILSNPSIWFLCGQQACRAGSYMFFASWFPTFLQETRGVSVEKSGYLQALIFCGSLTGCVIGGWLTDWILKKTGSLRWSRSLVGAGFLFGCSALILAAWTVEDLQLAIGLLACGALFSALVGPCAYSSSIDLGGNYVPQVFGLMNMVGNLATAASPIAVAYLFKLTDSWTFILLGFSAVYFVGAACWLFVDPTQKVEAELAPLEAN